jgi:hypothetical protein
MKFEEQKKIIIELVQSGEEPEKIADEIMRKIVNPLKREHDKKVIDLEGKYEALKDEFEDLEEEVDEG